MPVKRYRRRDLVREIVDLHRDMYEPARLKTLEYALSVVAPGCLGHLYTALTLREVTWNRCGLFYGLKEDE